ncbi:hypothetical protein FBU30_004733 [Linnemannia zychae]|nr:hypothetical protein FBU30_004733 [Linnemannia zychae]
MTLLFAAVHARLDFIIPKEFFTGSDYTIEWSGKPALGDSLQKVVLFKNDEPIITLCEGYVSGSGQCSFRLSENDVNTNDRGNYGFYIGLQAPDGLSLDRTKDFTIQHEEDPAEKMLRDGGVDSGDDDSEEEDEEDEDESRGKSKANRRQKEHNKKKNRIRKNKDRKHKSKATDEDDEDEDDDKGNKENEDDPDDEVYINMNMDMDSKDNTWNQPVYGIGGLYPEVLPSNTHSSRRPHSVKINAPMRIEAGMNKASAEYSTKGTMHQCFNAS